MSSIALILKATAEVEELAPDWVPEPLGAREAIRRRIREAGGVPMIAPDRFSLRDGGLWLELEIAEEEPPRSVTASGVFGDAERRCLRALCATLQARLYDAEEGRFAF
jgi:hypothetical protein